MTRKTKKTVDHNMTLQFRPSEPLGKMVFEFAEGWHVTRNEAARRLLTLGACGLTATDYPPIERFATHLGGVNSFFQAADRARAALNSANFTRSEFALPAMNDQERAAYLYRWVDRYLSGEQPQPDDAIQPTKPKESDAEVYRKIRVSEEVVGSPEGPAAIEVPRKIRTSEEVVGSEEGAAEVARPGQPTPEEEEQC